MRVQKIKEQGKEKSISPKNDTHMPWMMLLIHDGPLDRLSCHPLTLSFILTPPLCSRDIDLKRMADLVIFLTKGPKP